MSNIRLIAPAGGDHTVVLDWEAFVVDTLNYNSSDWDDGVSGNGGDQTALFSNNDFHTTSANAIDIDALSTATYYKCTMKPDLDNVSVLTAGAQLANVFAANTTNFHTSYPTIYPRIRCSVNHDPALDLRNSTTIEWHIEDLHLSSLTHRSYTIWFNLASTKDSYVDRIYASETSSSYPMFWGGGNDTEGGKIYVRSCFTGKGYGNTPRIIRGENIYFLGNGIMKGYQSIEMYGATSVGHQYIYGNYFVYNPDATVADATNYDTTYSNSDFNVTNANSNTAWDLDISGTNDISGSIDANVIENNIINANTDPRPLVGGYADGRITWSNLPADVQAAWPDTDLFGNTIVKSGTLTSGPIQIYQAPAGGAEENNTKMLSMII
jgi:hypothetical protein